MDNLKEKNQVLIDKMKKVMAKGTILNYPDFNKVFEIHTDASDRQLGAVISQEGNLLLSTQEN